MKKTAMILAACVLMLFSIAAACAQDNTNATVVIGDGAPIPYLNGFTSRMVTDAESIAGVTGSFPDIAVCAPADLQSRTGTWCYTLENLVLTDDVLGVFFTQTYSEAIPRESESDWDYHLTARIPNILLDGEPLPTLRHFGEGYPVDTYTQHSFMLCSLQQPIASGQTLTFGATWNNDDQVYEGGAQITVDRSRAADPTVAYAPELRVQKKMALWEGSAAIDYDFTVERVAYTPFGNRMLIRFIGTRENNQYLDCQLFDDAGKILNSIFTMQRFQINASKEHPVQNLNEIWFFGGEGSQSLTLVPLGGNWETSPATRRMAAVPLAELPADVEFENGATLHVKSFEMSENGFDLLYSTDGYTGYTDFDLGDANGNPLGFPFAGYMLDNRSRGLLGFGGSWSEEYKGKLVSRVTAEQLSQVKTLLIHYADGFPALIEAEQIEVPLSK